MLRSEQKSEAVRSGCCIVAQGVAQSRVLLQRIAGARAEAVRQPESTADAAGGS
jgi:hypothetical protein